MFRAKHKNKYLKMAICCLAAVLALSNFYVPRASAAESYFVAEGGTLALDELDPDYDKIITVRIKAAREMTIHSLEGYFTPVDGEDEELGYGFGEIDADFPGMGGIRYSLEDGWFEWIAEDFMSPDESSEGIHVQAGDSLVRINYEVKDGVDIVRRNMPAKIDIAVIDEGAETGEQIATATMDAYVVAGHDISVYKYTNGSGALDVPDIVIGGSGIEVGIVPESGYELTYLELNGEEVTDQVEDDVYRIIVGTESLTFSATFQRVYPVLEGDGGEHIIGSEEPLVFKIDNDVTTFCDTGVLMIDGEYQDMRTDCEVDPDNQTIILPANILNALALGEHSFEAWFSEPESGTARASFVIVEEDEVPGVPNTGVFTGEGGGVAITNNIISISFAVIICYLLYFIAAAWSALPK